MDLAINRAPDGKMAVVRGECKHENNEEKSDDIGEDDPRALDIDSFISSRNIILIPADSFDNIASFLDSNSVGNSPTSQDTSNTTECYEDQETYTDDRPADEPISGILNSNGCFIATTKTASENGRSSQYPEIPDKDIVDEESQMNGLLTSTTSLENSADWSNPEWRHHRKHIFILSCAGKPIYTRYGDENRQASLMGTMLALSQFLQYSQEKMDAIRCICTGDRKFVFLPHDHMVLVAVARSHESMPSLLLQLTYVYNQIISILTYNRLATIFKQHMNFDLRRLLSGAEKFINSLLDIMESDPCFILSAVRCLSMDFSARDSIGQIIAQNVKVKDLVFALLIAENRLIALVHLKTYLLHPVDLHLIFNLVMSSDTFKHAESWSPVCLPKLDSRAYLHAHISYLDETSQLCLILLSVDKDMFYTLSECKSKIQEKLTRSGYIIAMHEALKKKSYKVSEVGIPGILHFLYKSKTLGQFTEPDYDAPYSFPAERERLFSLYQCIYSRMHNQQRPLKILFHVGKYETVLGWVTTGFEMYVTFSPLISKPAAISSINKLLRWIKREEDRLFITNSHSI